MPTPTREITPAPQATPTPQAIPTPQVTPTPEPNPTPTELVAPQTAPEGDVSSDVPDTAMDTKPGQGEGSGDNTGNDDKGSDESNDTGQDSDTGSGTDEGAGSGEGNDAGEGNDEDSGNDEGSGTASRGGSGSSGGPFGITTGIGPRHIIYVLDISLSMVTRLKRARQEVRDALATLQPEESFNIIAFSNDITVFRNALVPVTPANIQQANAFLDGLKFEKSTNLEKALRKALAQPDVNLVVVITDGVPTQGQTNWKKLSQLVRSINRNKARIFTIGVVGLHPQGTDRSFEVVRLLQQIARDSRGEFKLFPLD